MNGLKVLTYAALVSVLAGCGDHDSSTGNVSIGDTSGDAIVGSGNLITHTEDIHDFDEAVIQLPSCFRRAGRQLLRDLASGRQSRRACARGTHRFDAAHRPARRQLRNITVEATVVMPDITRLDVSGATRVELRGFSLEHDLDLRGSGASTLAGSVSAHEVEMSISGATRELEGSATSLELRASGASSVDLEDFPVADATVDLSGASRAVLRVSTSLAVTASGASSLTFRGTPTLKRISISGASNVTSLD